MKSILNTSLLIFLTKLEPKAITTYFEIMSADPAKENHSMQIVIELSHNIADQLEPTNISRRVLELVAANDYRQGRIGAAEVRRMLSFSSRWETYEFLKREKAALPHTEEDLDQDVQSIQKVLGAE
jgi:predicted HTH domain antitoxin